VNSRSLSRNTFPVNDFSPTEETLSVLDGVIIDTIQDALEASLDVKEYDGDTWAPLTFNELTEAVGTHYNANRTTIVRHIRALRDAGVIESHQLSSLRTNYYKINCEALDALLTSQQPAQLSYCAATIRIRAERHAQEPVDKSVDNSCITSKVQPPYLQISKVTKVTLLNSTNSLRTLKKNNCFETAEQPQRLSRKDYRIQRLQHVGITTDLSEFKAPSEGTYRLDILFPLQEIAKKLNFQLTITPIFRKWMEDAYRICLYWGVEIKDYFNTIKNSRFLMRRIRNWGKYKGKKRFKANPAWLLCYETMLRILFKRHFGCMKTPKVVRMTLEALKTRYGNLLTNKEESTAGPPRVSGWQEATFVPPVGVELAKEAPSSVVCAEKAAVSNGFSSLLAELRGHKAPPITERVVTKASQVLGTLETLEKPIDKAGEGYLKLQREYRTAKLQPPTLETTRITPGARSLGNIFGKLLGA